MLHINQNMQCIKTAINGQTQPQQHIKIATIKLCKDIPYKKVCIKIKMSAFFKTESLQKQQNQMQFS